MSILGLRPVSRYNGRANPNGEDITEGMMSFGPVVAGTFYSDDAWELSTQVDRFIDGAPGMPKTSEIFGLISPHAGYVYSGPCAAHGYKALRGARYDVVVVIGLSHRVPGTLAILTEDAYRTPLGRVPIDVRRSKELLSRLTFATSDAAMFAKEHSIEVQLPFLQRVLPPFQAVLLSMREDDPDVIRATAEALDEVFADCRALFVASSDLSHFHPYDRAASMDRETLRMVEEMDLTGLTESCETGRNEMCGITPVLTLLSLYQRRGGRQPRVLSYMNSGDTAGDRDRVVGYGSVLLETPKRVDDALLDGGYTEDDRKTLLSVARECLDSWLRHGVYPSFEKVTKALATPAAAFVTLHKNGELRGCIGRVDAKEPLWECVREMAVAAATEDPRFPAVTVDEIADLHIEISVLTPARRVSGPSEIVPGRDGLIVADGFRRGLLLPQVAERYGWDAEEFLDHTCLKAGLSRNAWKHGGVEIQTFQAVVFAE